MLEVAGPSYAILAVASAGRSRAIPGWGANRDASPAGQQIPPETHHREFERSETMLDRRNGYEYEDLLACGRGELFGPGNAQLPLPPMLSATTFVVTCLLTQRTQESRHYVLTEAVQEGF